MKALKKAQYIKDLPGMQVRWGTTPGLALAPPSHFPGRCTGLDQPVGAIAPWFSQEEELLRVFQAFAGASITKPDKCRVAGYVPVATGLPVTLCTTYHGR